MKQAASADRLVLLSRLFQSSRRNYRETLSHSHRVSTRWPCGTSKSHLTVSAVSSVALRIASRSYDARRRSPNGDLPMSTHSCSRCWLHLIWETLRHEPMLDKGAAARASENLS